MELTAADLIPVRDLYLQGQYVQAWHASTAFGPLRAWSGPAARLLAGRLAMQLGSPRLGRQLHLVAIRQTPTYPEAIYYHARYRLEQFGPLSCWNYVRQHQDWSIAAPELRGDWLALQGLLWGRLRDFDRAEKFLQQAEQQAADRAWLQVERASVLEVADRLEDALAAARRSLEVQPWFRPGVQAVAHSLVRLGRVGEAIDLLSEAIEHLESGAIAAQLASLHFDRKDFTQAAKLYDRYEQLSPMMEPAVVKWLAARRADVLYALGDRTRAAVHAERADDKFYTAFGARLAESSGARRVLELDIPPDTTKPLTVHALVGQFWNQPTPPLPAEVLMPYDGLPDAVDRQRWDEAGWRTREFRLELPAVQRLLDAGIPFLITLVEAGYSQHRLVVGYDTIRETLFISDLHERRVGEVPLSSILERYGLFGPRCLALVPKNHPWPDGELPDEAAYNQLYELQLKLISHEHTAAREVLLAMQAAAPEARLTAFAEIAWARATAHPVLMEEALRKLLATHPQDNTLVLAQASVLRDLGRMSDRLQLLQSVLDKPGTDPLVIQTAAQMLLPDPRQQVLTDRLLRGSIRQRPHAAAGYFLLATQWWEHQRFDAAVEVYRMATCADDREEQFAEAYARATRVRGQAPEALRLFQQRAYRNAVPFPPAVRALFLALLDRDEPQQAFAAVSKAIDKATAEALKPNADAEATRSLGELLLFRAEQHSNFGKAELAEADLATAKPYVVPSVWFKSAARVARSKPDFLLALEHLQAYLQHEPLSAEGHRLTATLLADTSGRKQAARYLAEVCLRYPYFYPLHRYRAEFLYPEPDDPPIQATQQLLELCPRDAWAWRQLALIHADRKNHAEAQKAADQAAQLEPTHPSQFAVQAHIHRRADRIDEALATFREGIRLHPDHELSIVELVQVSRGLKEKKASLRHVAEVLHTRPHVGDGLLAYFEQSLRLIDDPEEQERFLAELERFLEERPDIWQTWSVVCQLLILCERGQEALALAREATERFPLAPRLWIDLAEAAKATQHSEERLEALRQAVVVAPGWVPAVREYAESLGEAEQYDEAIRVLERVVARSPLDPMAHWYLAERLWDADRSREALDQAKLAVWMDTGADPRAEIAWAAVMNWSERIDSPNEAVELARAIAGNRSGDPQAWLRLARCLNDYSQFDEALSALDRAIRLDPKNAEAHDMKAERLAALGRYDEALAAANPEPFQGEVPLLLQGRAAWIEARRGNFAQAIPMMQALVAIDPEYLWGWQQLAEWYNTTHQQESYLQAAEELMRLRPDHPLSLTMRGEARLLNGQRDEGKADLREALRISPNYSPAAAILFDAHLEDDEVREARSALAVLQEHMAGNEVLIKQIQFARHIHDTEAASRAFSDICMAAGDGPPHLLQAALREMERLFEDDQPTTLMRKAWESGEPFNPWAAMLWIDQPSVLHEQNFALQLSALDAVLKYYPDFLPAIDRRAELLATMGRYDDAKATCRMQGGATIPVALQGRVAWIEAQGGDKSKAIAQMQKLLQQNPDYSWGWRQLTYWYDELGRHRECQEAADHLVRLNPADPVAYAIRGESKRLLGDYRGAKTDYQFAFELDPTFEAAGLQLVSAQLATDDLVEAHKTLNVLREHSNNPMIFFQQVQLHARRGDLSAALDAYRRLLKEAQLGRSMLRDATQALQQAGWSAEAEAELYREFQNPECLPNTAAHWVEVQLLKDKPQAVADELPSLGLRNPAAAREAIITFAWGRVPTGAASESVAIIQRYAEILRGETSSWAKAGALLAEVGQFPLAAAWLADWEQREDVQPWMLRALADALRDQGDDAQALRVTEGALDLDSDDPTPKDFLAWMALTDAVDGRTNDAEEWLMELGTLGLSDGEKLLASFAESLVLLQQAKREDKPQTFVEAKDHLLTAVGACAPKDRPPGASRWYRKVVERLAADGGTFRAKLWAWWQRLRPAM